MVQRIILAALFTLSLAACATAPEGTEMAEKDQPDAKYCETSVGDRNQTEVCRQY